MCVVLAAVTLGGCGRLPKRSKPEPAGPFEYSVFVPSGSADVEGLEVDGKPLGAPTTSVAGGKGWKLVLPKAEHLVHKRVSVVLTTSCGSTKVPGQANVGIARSGTREAEDAERREHPELVLSEIKFAPPPTARVHVDADGLPAAKVTVGAYPLDAKRRTTVPLGACPTGADVMVDGVVVGKVPPPKDATSPPTVFVDAKGGRCYERVLHVYVEKDVDTRNMDRGAPKRLEGARVYVEDVDDFLTPSPSKVESKDAMPIRAEIRRCPAAPAKVAPAKKPAGKR